MQVNLIGLRKIDFENAKGEQVQGIKLFIAYPDENVYGNCTESRFVTAERFEKFDFELKDLIERIGEVIDITAFLNDVQSWVMLLLPDSPFKNLVLPEYIRKILGYINWLVPFYLIGNTLLAWTGAIVVYYAYQIILRWIKSIQ